MTAASAVLRGDVSGRDLLRLLVAAAAAFAVFVGASGRLVSPTSLAAGVALVLLAVAALRWTGAAMCTALVAISVVPVYWGRPVGGAATVAVPATVVAIVLVLAAATQARSYRVQALDVCYVGFTGFLTLAAALNVSHGASAAAGIAWRSLLPYAVWRLVGLRWLNWTVILRVLAATGTALAGFAMAEHSSGTNPFFTWVHPVYQADQWAHDISRNGVVRAEASFGEPISFGLFLAICVVAAVTLAVVTRHVVGQVLALAATTVMMIALLGTQSRAALATVLIATGVQLLRLLSARRAGRVLGIGVLVAAAIVVTPLGAWIQHAATSGSGTSREALSAQYRLAVFDVLDNADSYSLLGQRNDNVASVSDLARSQTGLKSLDNEYAHVLVTGGALAFVAFVALALLLLGSVVRQREHDPGARAITSALAAVTLALLVVALLTQFADIFGILVALVAADRQRSTRAVAS